MSRPRKSVFRAFLLATAFLGLAVTSATAAPMLGPEALVQAAGSDIDVAGYSVPSLEDLNADGLKDLIVGEGSGSYTAKVRIYFNQGTAAVPQFDGFAYAQSGVSDLELTGSGCLGLFPRVVDWNLDDRKDLVIGTATGGVKLYLNAGTQQNPTFDTGGFLQVGPAGSKTDISVVARATPIVVDWNADGRKDLAVGALDGRIHLFLNSGTDAAPDFLAETLAQENGAPLDVLSDRSSPIVFDWNGDGKKDLLSGNTNGQLLFYANVGTDAAPSFSGYSLVESDGSPIDLSLSPRSRPSLCDWTGDGLTDVLIGAGDGNVHLFQAVPEPATLALLGLAAVALVLFRFRHG